MTPGARVAAAIEVLDQVLEGANAEQCLTTWARSHRFAGSKDRAAIRDHVFGALRALRSHAALGGGMTGRAVMIGGERAAGRDPALLFTGEGYAPSALTEEERDFGPSQFSPGEALDMPDWLLPELERSLDGTTGAICTALRARAPVFLRANLARTTREGAQVALAGEGIGSMPHPLAKTALQVTEGERKISGSRAYADGLVELQDAASQAILEGLDIRPGMRVLDFCCGGGGKALALAAQGAQVTAHDIDPGRMRDLPARAKRAGVRITQSRNPQAEGPFDLVLLDAPCSGSGSWRRSPQGKWQLTQARLHELCAIQAGILDKTFGMVAPGGTLAYATCSLLEIENRDQVSAFRNRHPEWKLTSETRLTPLDGADGFYLAALTREHLAG